MQVADVPYTNNGKLIEVQVKKVRVMLSFYSVSCDHAQIINGAPVSVVNRETIRNPECLEEYREIAKLLAAEN